MQLQKHLFLLCAIAISTLACTSPKGGSSSSEDAIKPLFITEPTKHDTDDPAIWIHPKDPGQSLIVGTDKNTDGALFVYDLKGKIIPELTVSGLERPNNVDIEYGLPMGGDTIDIVVTGERYKHLLRIFKMPEMTPVDGGGIPVFEGEIAEEFRDVMGISMYKNPITGDIYAIVGRKNGPTDGSYLWQYKLQAQADGTVGLELIRKFGEYSGQKEIESIAVDDEKGYVYYSDEGIGVRKYHADPAKGNDELALFADTDFVQDNEGISIYDSGQGMGFILVSDQQANEFHIFPREGSGSNPHDHPLLRVVNVSTNESDGSEITSLPLGPDFPHGVFVAMSDDRTFHYYNPKAILDSLLLSRQ